MSYFQLLIHHTTEAGHTACGLPAAGTHFCGASAAAGSSAGRGHDVWDERGATHHGVPLL